MMTMIELGQGIQVSHSNGTVYESVIGDEKAYIAPEQHYC